MYNNKQLLEAAQAPAGRKELAAHAGAESHTILELANRADLAPGSRRGGRLVRPARARWRGYGRGAGDPRRGQLARQDRGGQRGGAARRAHAVECGEGLGLVQARELPKILEYQAGLVLIQTPGVLCDLLQGCLLLRSGASACLVSLTETEAPGGVTSAERNPVQQT
jgi:hypothetical protein